MNLLVLQSATALVILGAVSTNAQCNSSFIGYSLIGHVYKNFSAPTPLDCYMKCKQDEPYCRSFNFHADQDLCELNKRSKESHQADLQVSKFSVYFHSCYRDRYGSKPSLATNSCAEIIRHDDSIGDGLYWLNIEEENETSQVFCNMANNNGDMSSSFDLVFPTTRNVTNYVMADTLTQTLSEFTVSLWLKTKEKVLVPISYAVGSQMNSILIYIDQTGWLRFVVAEQQIDGFPGLLDDDRWHHVLATWQSVTGQAQVFIDGDLKITDNGGINTGNTIQGGGKVVLGLDQDSLGGGFDVEQSFVGELTHVYLWNTVLSTDVIFNMARVCREFPHPDHVVGWADFGSNLNGEVTRRNISRCHYDPPLTT
ncbi:sushi, von Willebrand factor type A, EGF and pentraxin domain-containing protein 1 [Exaiptasia diaphana]|uniref:Uncharacterized protein n=1 Tax=Exaiptasia diaphana TaxID=2652724 RepID=A0A913X9W8_EXADI|nr:sushi, von Willebrand factor type A, EGF and pentraxin domain-containing protein 1 [Exaiptasia diaphana]KXJ26646.1 Sushi, von Willebrand factor type A, EGF and pentraxin domain-containing protein 1 [Exaiptasia diaphana]